MPAASRLFLWIRGLAACGSIVRNARNTELTFQRCITTYAEDKGTGVRAASCCVQKYCKEETRSK